MAPQGGVILNTPTSVSPGAIPVAPMAKTAIQPAGVMNVRPHATIQGLNWTQLPGAASFAAAAPDGSLWVLSNGPGGPDKYIWHYANGTWSNISGLASRLTVAPDGTLYAINSGGGAYSYSGGTWTALGGGCTDITAASDGSIYVLSNGNSAGTDHAIWHYTNSWSQGPGMGVRIAASWDSNSFVPPSGTVSAGGLYVLNSLGNIYHQNTDNSFVQLPANASAIAPTTVGGVFVLGYPANANGNSIYYYNLDNPSWNAQSGAGVSISTDSAHLYVIGSSGGIYSTPITAFGKVIVSPTALTLTGTSAATAQTFGASETNYSGTFTQNSTCAPNSATIATISPASGSAPVTFTVTPHAVGSCNITISDTNSQSASVAVTVVGAIVLSPTSLNFVAAGSGYAQTFSASEANYSGTFTQSNSCNPNSGTIATVSPASGNAPVTFTVTPQSAGSCTVTIMDSNGQSNSLTVGVTTTSGGIN